MEFNELYPDRVTLGKDGIYRWSCQIDMSGNHSAAADQFRAAMLIICGSVCIITVIFAFLVGDLSFVWIPFACCSFVLLLSLLIFRLFMKERQTRFTVAYEMNDEAILTIRNPAVLHPGDMPLITAALSIDAAHPLEDSCFRTSAVTASQSVLTKYQNIRRISEFRSENRLCLEAVPAARHISVPAEDYDMVLDFIRARISDLDQKWNPYY